MAGLSAQLFPALSSSLNLTDYLGALSKIVTVSFFGACLIAHLDYTVVVYMMFFLFLFNV
jgi:hypothetical protein